MGEIVTDRLEENFRELVNYDFTAQIGRRLDRVCESRAEGGKRCWILTSSTILLSNSVKPRKDPGRRVVP
ncbi:hypothetical protein KCP75_06650 [Salmonella enterica subsp. enterica]|nr:hypothetical protein KCP75_06650 [Salmonella enterica subsp. enterica]